MAKQIVYGDQARQAVLRGINQLADAVIRAIEEPMRWIATNAGHEGSIVVQKVRKT
jgi:chaperonin GroEL (HSP60 family)